MNKTKPPCIVLNKYYSEGFFMSELQNEKNADGCPLTVRKIRRSAIRKEIGADFVLPDYMGDIKRVLKYTATVIPCNSLICETEASFLATVTFRVSYLDGEDMFTEASFTADSEFVERLGAGCVSANAEYKTQAVTVRLGGPRKISAKATVICDVSLLEEHSVCEKSAYEGAESLKREIGVHSLEYLSCAEREYAEEIERLNEMTADELEVVKSSASAFIDSVHKTDGGINLSGYADALILLRGEDGIIRLEKRIPIEEHIECELKEGSAFIPGAYVSGATVNLNNVSDENECAVSVVMNMTVECFAAHHYSEEYTVVTDAFYEGCKNKCSYENVEYSALSDCIFEKTSFPMTVQRTEEPMYDILESELCVKNTHCEIVGGDALVSCDIELHMVARGAGAESCYSIKEKGEFSKKLRLSSPSADKIEVNAMPCEVSVSFDGDKIYVESQLLISLIAEKRECERVLSNIVFEREAGNEDRSIVVYYPEAEETLWSVSKKYSVSPSKIAAVNGIHDDSIEKCSRIIITK